MNGLKHKKGRTKKTNFRIRRNRSHRRQDGAREPCAHFPDDARSTRQTPSNDLVCACVDACVGACAGACVGKKSHVSRILQHLKPFSTSGFTAYAQKKKNLAHMATVLGGQNRLPYTRNFDDFGKGRLFLADSRTRNQGFDVSHPAASGCPRNGGKKIGSEPGYTRRSSG